MGDNQPPMKGIKSLTNNNFSYAHSVLQSISCLDCAKKFLEEKDLNSISNDKHSTLEYQLLNLINALNNSKEGYSREIIDVFEKIYYKNQSSLLDKNILNKDPYNFLLNLINFLYLETNNQNLNYDTQLIFNPNPEDQKNDNKMYLSFMDYVSQTQNSLICNYFFNIMKYTIKCSNCGDYYSYKNLNIIKINVDKTKLYRDSAFQEKNGTNLTLDECIKFYCGGNTMKCKICKNNSFKYTEFCHPAKVLIFFFYRENHLFYGDINFPYYLDLNEYFCQKAKDLNIKSNYILKACISYDNNNKNYFADCYVQLKNMSNGNWYRFIDEQVSILSDANKDIYQYEPQILIYEINNQNNNQQIINNNNDLINNNQFNNLMINNEKYFSNNNISNNINNNGQLYNDMNNNNLYNDGINNNNQFYNDMNNNNLYNNGINNNNQFYNDMNNNNQFNNGINNNQFNNNMNNNNQFDNNNNINYNNNNQFNNNMNNNNQFDNNNNINYNNNNQFNNNMNNNNQFNNNNILLSQNPNLINNQNFINMNNNFIPQNQSLNEVPKQDDFINKFNIQGFFNENNIQ